MYRSVCSLPLHDWPLDALQPENCRVSAAYRRLVYHNRLEELGCLDFLEGNRPIAGASRKSRSQLTRRMPFCTLGAFVWAWLWKYRHPFKCRRADIQGHVNEYTGCALSAPTAQEQVILQELVVSGVGEEESQENVMGGG